MMRGAQVTQCEKKAGLFSKFTIQLYTKPGSGRNGYSSFVEHNVVIAPAGDAYPREWTGIWDTKGYNRIWVIVTEDGSGLKNKQA